MKPPQQIQPNIAQTIPEEFMPFARDLFSVLGGRLNQPTVNPYQQGVLNAFFGSPSTASFTPRPLPSPVARPSPILPSPVLNQPGLPTEGGGMVGAPIMRPLPVGGGLEGLPIFQRSLIRPMEGIEPPISNPPPPIGGGPPPSPVPIPSPTPGQPTPLGQIMPPLGPQMPAQAAPLGGVFGQGLGFLGGALGGQTNPLLQQATGAAGNLLSGGFQQPLFGESLNTLQNIMRGNINQPGLAQTQGFLGSLMAGQVPESLRTTAQRNLEQAQNALNAQQQLRGGFFSTHGLQQQQALAQDLGNNLNNLVFQNAMGAAPLAAELSQLPFQQQMAAIPGALQASQLPFQQALSALPIAGQLGQIPFQQQMGALQGMFPLMASAMGLAQTPNQIPEAIGAGTNLLGAMRGTPMQAQFSQDPLAQILSSLLPFIVRF